VVAGKSGVGKTRLARAAAEIHAQHGWTVRRVAGTTTGRAVTLGAFARWADATDTSPLSLTRKVFGGLTAGTHGAPLLVFVDDAHLLDDMSALIVHQIALQGAARIIATIRTGEPAPDAVTALWKDGLLRRLELQPLSRNESDQLLRVVLGGPVSTECADRMWRLSRGNVLFLHHLVEHERESGRLARVGDEWRLTGTPLASPSLVELVERQIGAVPDDVREVVDLVAIAEPIDRTVLSELADPRSVEAAEQRDLIAAAATGGAVYVGHPFYGEIRLSQCGPLRLQRLRGRVASVVARLDDVDPLRLGLLWLESDLTPDVEILSRAAYISGSRLDLGLAERLARAAAEAYPNPLTKLQLAYILFIQENGEEAEVVLDTLDPGEMAIPGFVDGVILRARNLLWPLRNPDESHAVIEAALGLGDDARIPSLRTFRAVQHAMAAQPVKTVTTMAEVDYESLDSFGRLLGYSAETIALGDLGHLERAAQMASEGYRVLDESPLDSFHGTGLAEFHAYALLAAGNVADAHAVSEHQHLQYAELPGLSRSMAVAALGMTALAMGDLAAALRFLSSPAASFGDYGNISGLFYRFRILLTEALARSGQIEAAVASLEATRQGRHPAYQYVESGYLLAFCMGRRQPGPYLGGARNHPPRSRIRPIARTSRTRSAVPADSGAVRRCHRRRPAHRTGHPGTGPAGAGSRAIRASTGQRRHGNAGRGLERVRGYGRQVGGRRCRRAGGDLSSSRSATGQRAHLQRPRPTVGQGLRRRGQPSPGRRPGSAAVHPSRARDRQAPVTRFVQQGYR
jgi:hypothetical protein